MTSKQRTWGQFATPTDVADLLLGFCLRRPEDRVLDPSCGDGALLKRAARWKKWLAPGGTASPRTLYGIELDREATAAAEIPEATILHANFLALDPADLPSFDAVIGNPPYTRSEWIGRLDAAAEAQLPLFPDNVPPGAAARRTLLPRDLGAGLDGRAGLHAYFLLHSAAFLREGGRLGFVVPNGWLDVAYGQRLKQFILDHFRVLAVVESAVERWFAAASVNTCVIILERSDAPAARAAGRVRLARLRQPLRDLLGYEPDDARRPGAVDRLIGRLMPPDDRQGAGATVRVREQATLDAGERWGALLRAPDVYLRPSVRPVVPLNQWATVQRGFTTGANDFFYLDPTVIEKWAIEPAYRRPLLKSLRGASGLRIGRADCGHELLAIPPGADLAGSAVARYLAWGVAQGVARRRTCAARSPWYVLPEQTAGDLLLAKGIWQRHFAPLSPETIVVDQQIYRVRLAEGVPPNVAAALLNSTWFALHCEQRGRVNLGEGVLWLATYELEAIPLPDPRELDAGQRRALDEALVRLAGRRLADTSAELERDDRRALDELVFDLVGLSPAERAAARAALVECVTGRRLRAERVGVAG